MVIKLPVYKEEGFYRLQTREVKMEKIFNLNSHESLKAFLEVCVEIDKYLKTLPLKEDSELRLKIELNCPAGTILRFERWQNDLYEKG